MRTFIQVHVGMGGGGVSFSHSFSSFLQQSSLLLSPISISAPLHLSLSHQVVLLEVELQDGVLDGGEHESDVLRVRGAGEVGVDDLVAVGVQVHEHLQDELAARLGVPLGPCSILTHTHEGALKCVAFRFNKVIKCACLAWDERNVSLGKIIRHTENENLLQIGVEEVVRFSLYVGQWRHAIVRIYNSAALQ